MPSKEIKRRLSIHIHLIRNAMITMSNSKVKKQQIRFYTQTPKAPNADKWATSWENLFNPYANNKDADQPAHPRSLISVLLFAA